jgi:hypothetical protein
VEWSGWSRYVDRPRTAGRLGLSLAFYHVRVRAAPPSASHRPGSEPRTVILGEGGGKRDGNSWHQAGTGSRMVGAGPES